MRAWCLILVVLAACVEAAHHSAHRVMSAEQRRRMRRNGHRIRNAHMDSCNQLCRAVKATIQEPVDPAAPAVGPNTVFPGSRPGGTGLALQPALTPATHLLPILTAERWEAGPCLSEWPHTNHGRPAMTHGWVCDVAHHPRQTIDDETENQCKAYVNGKAHHFCEVDPDCGPIRCQ